MKLLIPIATLVVRVLNLIVTLSRKPKKAP